MLLRNMHFIELRLVVTSLMNCVEIMSQQKSSVLKGWNIF